PQWAYGSAGCGNRPLGPTTHRAGRGQCRAQREPRGCVGRGIGSRCSRNSSEGYGGRRRPARREWQVGRRRKINRIPLRGAAMFFAGHYGERSATTCRRPTIDCLGSRFLTAEEIKNAVKSVFTTA